MSGESMRLIVYHSSYGCDTGCCGHIIEDIDTSDRKFEFGHPHGQNYKEYAEDFVREEYGEEHVKDLDWDNCEIMDN